MNVRDWIDPRDSRRWTVSLAWASKPVLAFGSGRDVYTVEVDFTDGLQDRSDEEFEQWLDRARGTPPAERTEPTNQAGGEAPEAARKTTRSWNGPANKVEPEPVPRSPEPLILVVEDDPGHSALIKAAFGKNLAHARLHFVLGGWEAKAYLARESPHHEWQLYPPPSLIILDLGLPDITGLEILEWMAEWEWLAKIPVIVFTASGDPAEERRAYELGVRRYMRKPNDYGALVKAVQEELGASALPGPTTRPMRAPRDLAYLAGQPTRPKRLSGLPLFGLSLVELTVIVVAYEAMRYVSTSGALSFPLYVMAGSYIVIAALVVTNLVTRIQRRRRVVEVQNEGLIAALQRSLEEVERLNGLLPICARCKKVKDSEGYWHQIETYISSRSEAMFRHGLCDDCVQAYVPDNVDQAG